MDDVRKSKMIERSTVPSRLTVLEREKIPFEEIKGGIFSIAGGAFVYYPSIGNWRSADHKRAGYTVAGLVQAVKDADLLKLLPVSTRAPEPEKPVTGRDSVAPSAGPDLSAELTRDPVAHAEPVTGPTSAKLKTVWP